MSSNSRNNRVTDLIQVHGSSKIRVILFLGLLVLSAYLLFTFSKVIAETFNPWFSWVCSQIESRYHVETFKVDLYKSEAVFYLRLTSDGPVEAYGKHLPKMDVSATTIISHLLQHIFIFLAALYASFIFLTIKPIFLVGSLAIGLFISTGLDIPLNLLGSINGLIIETLAPQELNSDLLVGIANILNNGGRMGLALSISLLCVCFSLDKSSFDKIPER